MRKLAFILLSILLFFSFFSNAQQYIKSIGINPTDSFYLTSSLLSADNFIYTSSLVNKTTIPGGSGIPGMQGVGELVFRKLNSNGNIIWEVPFIGSKAVVMNTQEFEQDKILISGAYFDSLDFGDTSLMNIGSRSNAFIACYDTSGNFHWTYHPTPNPNTSQFYYIFDDYNNNIYLPSYNQWGLEERIQVLNSLGDSINSFQLSDNILLISEFQFDSNGNIYLCGTGDPHSKISGEWLGNDSTTFGYATFIAKLNNQFQHEWSYTFEYVTFDFYPKMALGSSQIALIVDSMPNTSGAGNFHMLRYFDSNGNVLKTDSIGPGFFSRMHRSMALTRGSNGFYFSTIRGFDTIVIKHADSQYNYTELAKLDFSTASLYPWLISNDSTVYYNHSFVGDYAVANNTDTVYNSKYPGSSLYDYQQFLVKISQNTPNISTTELDRIEGSFFTVFPNPNNGGILRIKGNDGFIPQSLRFYNSLGELIKDIDSPIDKTGEIVIDISSLKSGVYFISIIENDKEYIEKWIRIDE